MAEGPLIAMPDYDVAVDAFVRSAVEESMRATDPVYAQIRRVRYPEGVERTRVDVDGISNDSPEVHMSTLVEISRSDVVAGNLEQFHSVVAEVAQSNLTQLMRQFFEHVGDVAESVGNSVPVDGPLNWDALLDGFEKVEWADGPGGTLTPPQMVAGVDVTLPPPTVEQAQRLRGMTARKQEERVSLRRSRRLR